MKIHVVACLLFLALPFGSTSLLAADEVRLVRDIANQQTSSNIGNTALAGGLLFFLRR